MSDVSTFLLFLRVGFSLAVVLALIWAAARFAKRRGKIATRHTEAALDVVARRQLGRRGSLVVVESAGRRLLVGVTDTHIGLVADLSGDGADRAASEPAEVAVTEVLTAGADGADGTDGGDRAGSLGSISGTNRADRTGSGSADVVALPRRPAVPAGPKRESLVDALRDLTVRR